MNIKEAKEEIIHTVKAYTAKEEFGKDWCARLRCRLFLSNLSALSFFGNTGIRGSEHAQQKVYE